MFSFLNFLNFKLDSDKTKASNSLSGKTLNLNSPEGRALNIFNNKSPITPKQNGNITSLRSNNKETVTSPGFSHRITQKAHEMMSTIPNTDATNMTSSYTLDMNCSNTVNNAHTIPKDLYDKKRKLMESLDNFGVRKRTRQESGVEAFVYRRQKTINESNTSDRGTVINGHSHRSTQPMSTISSKSVNIDNKKTKRHGDFGVSMCHLQKKPRTRNNEILSSYSSSKFLQTGQKRPYPIDYESESPNRKHCKSCTCCGSTIILDNQNNQDSFNKSDKTTETDMSEDLVTFAASRIFNRSGKTQRVKKICMKTILDDVFDDDDPIPYTSLDKVEEKKKKAQKNVIMHQHTVKPSLKDSNQSVNAIPSTVTSTIINEVQPSVTSILSTASTSSVLSPTLITTSSVQSKTLPTFGFSPSSENVPKTNGVTINNTTLQLGANNSVAFETSSIDKDHKQTNEVDGKTPDNQTPESAKNISVLPKNTVQSPNNEQHKLLFETPEKIKDINKSHILGENDLNIDKNKQFQFATLGEPKPNEPINNLSLIQPDSQNLTDNSKKELTPSLVFGNRGENTLKQSTPIMQFGVPKTSEKQSIPVIQFNAPKVDEKQSIPVMQFNTPKSNDKQSTPVLQFGIPKSDEKQLTPLIQFGTSKSDEKQSTPIMQFNAPKSNDKQSTPVLQFGMPKSDEKQSTPIIQFGTSKSDEKQSTPIMQFCPSKADDKKSLPIIQFGTTKESDNSIPSTSLFTFGNNQKSNENTKPVEPIKFDFGSLKPHDSTVTASSTQPTNVIFGSNNLPNKNVFNFGKTDNISLTPDNPPKYDGTTEKSSPKLQFGALSTPVFGTSNLNQSKPQFSTSVGQSVDNQGPKIVFGNLITENKPTTTTAPSMLFTNNTNPVFQFSNSSSKSNDKPPEISNNAFQFSSNKSVSSFGGSVPPNFGEKPSFQFNSEKKEESKTQFSTPAFGSQSNSTPFKFGDNNKPTSFGTSFTPNQPLQFTNSTDKNKEPFKFGAALPTSNAFQFSANKTDNVKFGQASNTFSTPGFSGFGNSTPQQSTTTFGSVASSQPSLFGNINSPTTSPTFGSVASPTNTFRTNQGFQFGSTNNAPNNSSTFAFGGNTHPSKPEGAFNFNAAPTTASPFQFGQAPLPLSTSQFGGTTPQGSFGFGSPPMPGTASSQPLFSMGTAPAGERKKAKAVRRRQ